MTKRVTAVMVAGVLLLASCSGAGDEEPAVPVPPERADSEDAQHLDEALQQADLALTELDGKTEGAVYKGIRQAGRGVDIDTTLPPTADSVDRAVDLCATAAPVVDGYRVSVHARNGRLLAFKIQGGCKRVHMKATTTLWNVRVLHSN